MKASWLRFAAFVVAIGLLVLGDPASASASTGPGGACLTPEVGDAISEKLNAHAFDGVLPTGWIIREIAVSSERIDLDVTDEEGRGYRVSLSPRGSPGGANDGSGTSFSYALPSGAPSPDGRRALLDHAAPVDAAGPAAPKRGGAPPGTDHRWLAMGAPLPKAAALFIAALEIVLVGGGLFVAHRWRRAARPIPEPSRGMGWPILLAVFVASLGLIHTASGASPILWLDTLNDQRDVMRCLASSACTSLGEETSIHGIHHATGWLDLLALGALARLGVDELHVLLQVLGAAGAVLVASLAARGGGRPAGLLAALTFLSFVPAVEEQLALYDICLLPFLGAVFLFVGAEAAERPRPASIALVALVASVIANVHAVCILSGASVVWIALLAPRRKLALACLGGLVFAASTFAIGPGTWISNAAHALSMVRGSGSWHGHVAWNPAALFSRYAWLAGLAASAAILARRSPNAEVRGLVRAAAAISLPLLVASVAAESTTTVHTNDRYLAHAVAAGAVLTAALVALAPAVLASMARPARDPARWSALCCVMASVLVISTLYLQRRAAGVAGHDLDVTFNEASAIPRELSARGWNYARTYRGLRSRQSAVILSSFDLLAPGFPVGPAGDDPTSVYALKVRASAMPPALPQGWVVADRSATTTLVLVFARSSLDWGHYQACDSLATDRPCRDSGLSLAADEMPTCVYCVPGMPPPNEPGHHALQLRIPVLPNAAGPSEAIFMPRRWDLCGGSVVQVSPTPATISADGRRATWVSSPEGPSTVELRWEIGSADCSVHSYSGLPPFFIEGDPETVEAIEHLGL